MVELRRAEVALVVVAAGFAGARFEVAVALPPALLAGVFFGVARVVLAEGADLRVASCLAARPAEEDWIAEERAAEDRAI